jgi:hypothetical protein
VHKCIKTHLATSRQLTIAKILEINPVLFQSKSKANYNVVILILLVEEKLPNGAQVWQEVAALYQHHSGELILQGHDKVIPRKT